MRSLSVMQGRLSQERAGVVQHFPVGEWELEFEKLDQLFLDGIEWTIDERTFESHPLVDPNLHFSPWVHDAYGKALPDKIITCDFFMQLMPFDDPISNFDSVEKRFSQLLNSQNIGEKCILVIPFVDDGAPRSIQHWNDAYCFVKELISELRMKKASAAIEFEIEPIMQRRFVENFNDGLIGVNFDMGNSAALGFDPSQEIQILQDHIKNVHIKDRVRGGKTVPLGLGSVDFKKVAYSLREIDYDMNLTLQCARKTGDDPVDVVRSYVNFSIKVGLV